MRTLPSALVVAAALAAALAACPAASSRPAAPDSGADMLPQRGKVYVQARDGREFQLDVEIASRPAERERGLMFRRAMPENEGMIFVFPEESELTFWMKNTLIPLDMVFADRAGRIVGIVANAEPQTTVGRGVGAPSTLVLEVNGGWCARHGVAAGDRLRLEGMYDLR
jgi:uncharacterized membrane protein (UPF0127 family)